IKMAAEYLVGLILCLSFCSTVDTLQCYQCVDVSSSSSLINTVGHSDPNCESVSNYATTTKTCQTGEACGYVKGKVDLSVNLLVTKVDATITLNIRDCMAVASGTSMKCYRNQYYTDIINEALSFIGELVDVKFDGDVCFCRGDLCKPCGSQSTEIFGICFAYWVLGAIGGGVFLVIVLLVCCCCCCCCRKNRPVGRPNVFIQTTGGVVSQGTALSLVPPQQKGYARF
ncbi:unnamed protein product, partial [Owenia fusiformis]